MKAAVERPKAEHYLGRDRRRTTTCPTTPVRTGEVLTCRDQAALLGGRASSPPLPRLTRSNSKASPRFRCTRSGETATSLSLCRPAIDPRHHLASKRRGQSRRRRRPLPRLRPGADAETIRSSRPGRRHSRQPGQRHPRRNRHGLPAFQAGVRNFTVLEERTISGRRMAAASVHLAGAGAHRAETPCRGISHSTSIPMATIEDLSAATSSGSRS